MVQKKKKRLKGVEDAEDYYLQGFQTHSTGSCTAFSYYDNYNPTHSQNFDNMNISLVKGRGFTEVHYIFQKEDIQKHKYILSFTSKGKLHVKVLPKTEDDNFKEFIEMRGGK